MAVVAAKAEIADFPIPHRVFIAASVRSTTTEARRNAT
jgi:hypothetical protein